MTPWTPPPTWTACVSRSGPPTRGDPPPQTIFPWRRFWARTLDLILCTFLYFSVLALLGRISMLNRTGGYEILDLAEGRPCFCWSPCTSHLWGATPGKFLLGLQRTGRWELFQLSEACAGRPWCWWGSGKSDPSGEQQADDRLLLAGLPRPPQFWRRGTDGSLHRRQPPRPELLEHLQEPLEGAGRRGAGFNELCTVRWNPKLGVGSDTPGPCFDGGAVCGELQPIQPKSGGAGRTGGAADGGGDLCGAGGHARCGGCLPV